MDHLWTTGAGRVTALPASKGCPLCGLVLPAAAFGRNGAYLSSYCRACASRREVERQQQQRQGKRVPAPRTPPPAEAVHLSALAASYLLDGAGSVADLLAHTRGAELRRSL